MSRLDRHVAFVQGKLAFARFLTAVAYTTLGFFAVLWLAVVIQRIFHIAPPKPIAFAWAGLGVAVVAAIIYSMLKKPTTHEAAVAIDERLGLKEKFSTALFVRNTRDPFAVAAVRDAEREAENVSLHKRFPLAFPRMGYWTVGAAIVVLMTAWLLPTDMDLFGREAQRRHLADEQAKRDVAKKKVEEALAVVNSYPKAVQNSEAIQIAKRDLEKMLNQPITDPAQANRTAFKALEQSNEALKEEIKRNEKFAMAQANDKMLRSMNPPTDEQGPVADAQRDIAKGDFSKAVENLNDVANKFDKMSDADQKKAAQQMQNLAKQIEKMSKDPAQMQKLAQQLQQQGMNQQMAQQLAKTMQQAAQGNQQAQQQLQQMQQQAQQAMQKMSPQQQQAMQNLMKQMQAQSQSQAQAQQMAQAAQQMAKAMQQGASKQGNQQQQGNQQGQMAQAQQAMQQAAAQMDAVQKDAEQMSAAQDATSQAENDAADQGNPNNNGNNQQARAGMGRTGEWRPGDTNRNGNGQGGPGRGRGNGIGKEEAPYAIKKEAAPVQDIANGRILASTFVKAGTVKGESKVELAKVAKAAEQDVTDEVDEEAPSKESQKVVKDYFETMQKSQ
jgi:hypothetical protein